MINNIRKTIVRVAVMSVMLAILSYIFWPEAKVNDTMPEVTSTLAIDGASRSRLVLRWRIILVVDQRRHWQTSITAY